MSIELEVRSDDSYSRTASRDTITTLLVKGWGATRESDSLFVCRRDGCLVEVDLGRPDPPADKADALQWVGFRVPAGAKLASAEKSLRMAVAVAEHVGWRVFDPQRDGYVDPAELLPGPPLRQEVVGLFAEVHAEGAFGVLRRLGVLGDVHQEAEAKRQGPGGAKSARAAEQGDEEDEA